MTFQEKKITAGFQAICNVYLYVGWFLLQNFQQQTCYLRISYKNSPKRARWLFIRNSWWQSVLKKIMKGGT